MVFEWREATGGGYGGVRDVIQCQLDPMRMIHLYGLFPFQLLLYRSSGFEMGR